MNWTHLLFRFDGRISRKPYWIATCVLFAAAILSLVIEYFLNNERLGPIFSLLILYPNLAVMVKRAHDRDMSLWSVLVGAGLVVFFDAVVMLQPPASPDNPGPLEWSVLLALILLVPLFVYLFIVLGFLRGTRGPNLHGPDPLQGQT